MSIHSGFKHNTDPTELQKLYESGMSTHQLAEYYGVTATTIRNFMLSNGIALRPASKHFVGNKPKSHQTRAADIDEATLRQLYCNDSLSAKAISKQLNSPIATIRYLIGKWKLQRNIVTGEDVISKSQLTEYVKQNLNNREIAERHNLSDQQVKSLRTKYKLPRFNKTERAADEFVKKYPHLTKSQYYDLLDKSWWEAQFSQGLTVPQLSVQLNVERDVLAPYMYKTGLIVGDNFDNISCGELLINQISSTFRYIHRHNRTIINPKELDFVFGCDDLAVEVNGEYWHSTEKQPDQYYHQNKSIQCMLNDITLLHVWHQDVIKRTDLIHKLILTSRNVDTICTKFNVVEMSQDEFISKKLTISLIDDLNHSARYYKLLNSQNDLMLIGVNDGCINQLITINPCTIDVIPYLIRTLEIRKFKINIMFSARAACLVYQYSRDRQLDVMFTAPNLISISRDKLNKTYIPKDLDNIMAYQAYDSGILEVTIDQQVLD